MPDDVAHIWELLNPDTKEAENIHFTSLAQPSLHLFDANSKAYRRSKEALLLPGGCTCLWVNMYGTKGPLSVAYRTTFTQLSAA